MARLSSWYKEDDVEEQEYKNGDDDGGEVCDDDMASLSFWYEDSDVEEEEEGEYKDGDDDGDECDDDDMARLWNSCETFLLPCVQINEYQSWLPGQLLSRRFHLPTVKRGRQTNFF